LAPVVESELRQLARAYLRKEASGNTLEPADLVNEAYLRLIGWSKVAWQNPTHLYAVAAKMMRRVLVNDAIARRSRKRGGSAILVSLTEAETAPDRSTDTIALNEALESLAKFDDRKSRIIELRFFGGLSTPQTAEVLGISLRTVHRDWDFAPAWSSASFADKHDRQFRSNGTM
jgi:RNA polymerase sigma factor (TIGR02999 family)